MTSRILTNISDENQLMPDIDSIDVGLHVSFGDQIITKGYSVGNAHFSVSQPGKEGAPLHSHNFNQCIGILGISAGTRHQIAHICPGHWVHDQHGTEILEHNIGLLTKYIEKWKEANIVDNGIQIFGGREGKGYNESTKILGVLLYSIFGYYPQALAAPSIVGEFQHMRTEKEKIIHLRTNEMFTKKSVWEKQGETPTPSLFERIKRHLKK